MNCGLAVLMKSPPILECSVICCPFDSMVRLPSILQLYKSISNHFFIS